MCGDYEKFNSKSFNGVSNQSILSKKQIKTCKQFVHHSEHILYIVKKANISRANM